MTELVSIHPGELRFPFELRKQISCSLNLVNNTDDTVAFKVKTTSPKKYCVRPNTGVLSPRGSTDVTVTMQVQREAPPDMQCKDKFLVQTVVVPATFQSNEISELFDKESGHEVFDTKLRVLLTPPPQPPSPVAELPEEEGLSPKATTQNGNTGLQHSEPKDNNNSNSNSNNNNTSHLESSLAKVNQELSAMRKERDMAVQLTQRLQQELATKATISKDGQAAGFSFLLVLLVGLIGVLLGYLLSS